VSSSTELLLLRLALIAIVFVFLLVAAGALVRGLRAPAGRGVSVARRRQARLIVVSPAETGLARGVEIGLAGVMTIGRDMGNGIVLADSSISGRHAVIEDTGRGWVVRDLGSTNGTFVEGRQAGGRGAQLEHGRRLTLGAVTFRFEG
jgi:hypothetical protein